MADNFLERHRRDYEAKKEAWLRRKRHLPKLKGGMKQPEDESL